MQPICYIKSYYGGFSNMVDLFNNRAIIIKIKLINNNRNQGEISVCKSTYISSSMNIFSHRKPVWSEIGNKRNVVEIIVREC